jgi:phenylacetate-CoA ligase
MTSRRTATFQDRISRYVFFPVFLRLGFGAYGRAGASFRRKLVHLSWPREELLRMQHARLQELLRFCFASNPFYRKRLESVGLKADSTFSPRDMARIPPLVKADLGANFEALQSTGSSPRHWLKNSSGGSTGNPVVLIQDRAYRDEGFATTWVSNSIQGWQFGDRVAYLWGAPKDVALLRTYQFRIGEWLRNSCLYDAFNMGPGQMKQFDEDLRAFQPAVIVAYANSINLFARFLMESGIKPNYPTKSIISSAETLTESMRETIAQCFQVPVFNRYGSREVGNIASECECHSGLHLHMGDHYVEVVDLKTGKPVWDEPGKILITLLTNRAMPLVRYEIGDVGVLTKEFCPCGRSTLLLKKVLGRSSDFITTSSGRLIHGEYFTHAFYGFRGIRQFQFVQEGLGEFTVRIVKANDFDAAALPRLDAEIRAALGNEACVRYEFPDSIAPLMSGKYRFTVSHLPVALDARLVTSARALGGSVEACSDVGVQDPGNG